MVDLDAIVEEARARLGYYPGHEPTCEKRGEPYETAECMCGPSDDAPYSERSIAGARGVP